MSFVEYARRRPLWLFFVLAYAISWSAWAPVVLSRSGLGVIPIDGPLEYILPGGYGPLAAALIVQRLTTGRWSIGPLVTSWRSMASGLAVGWACIATAVLILPALWLTGTGAGALNWTALSAYPLAIGIAAVQGGPIGEEPGWRGFALPRLQAEHHPVTAALVLGVIWACWHLPLFLLPAWQHPAPLLYVPLLVAVSVILSVGFNLSRGSIFIAIALHAVFNGSPRLFGALLGGAPVNPPLPVSSGAVLAIAFVMVAAVLIFVTRGRLTASRNEARVPTHGEVGVGGLID
jgi:membrane protease YdiL (CAAX protease family)